MFDLSLFIVAFGLSSSYCNVWFVVGLLRRSAFRCLVVTLYLYENDSNKQNGFDQSKISYYCYQYVEELESYILQLLCYQIHRLYSNLLCY